MIFHSILFLTLLCSTSVVAMTKVENDEIALRGSNDDGISKINRANLFNKKSDIYVSYQLNRNSNSFIENSKVCFLISSHQQTNQGLDYFT